MLKISSRILHEIAFRINAQRNGSFDQAFNGARSVVAAMQNEIQRLNQTQNNISGYQRQQQQVQRSEQRLNSLRRQYDLVQREIRETTGSTAGLERQSLRLQERINSASNALERERQRLRETGEALRRAGVDTERLISEEIRLAEETRDLQRAQEEAARGADNFGRRAAGAFDAAGQAMTAAGITVALGKIAEGYQRSIDLAGQLESRMSDVQALSGADQQAMNVLADKAKALGASTKYTAPESAQAMTYMAMAGWDEQDMLNGMTGVLNLASAAGEDIALVSDIITDNLSAFHMTAADTERFADVLAAAATNANTNVAIMGETFKNSASIAGALGYKIEDVALAVGLMANNGVKGSIAGTALKNTFNGLLEGVTLSGAAFGEYAYSAINADGTMKSFGDTINELRGYFEKMTEAERVQNAIDIAGAYGYNGLLGILLAADEDYKQLTDSINNCSGAAERMAEIKLDNLQGDITLAQSAADALQISVGEQFLPIMRKVYQTGTVLLNQADEYVQKNPATVKAGTVFIGTLGGLAAGITGVSAAVRIYQALNVASLFAGPAGVLLGLSAAAAAVAGGFVAIREGAFDASPAVRELTQAAKDAERAMQEADQTYNDMLGSTMAAADVAEHYIDRLEAMGDVDSLQGEHKQEYLNTLTLLCRTMPELSQYIDTQTGKIEGGTEALRENTDAWKENALAQARQRQLESYADAVAAADMAVAETSIELTAARDVQQTIESQAADLRAEIDSMYAEAQAKAEAHNEVYRGTDEKTFAEDILSEQYPEYEKLKNQLNDLERQSKRAGKEVKELENALGFNQTAADEASDRYLQVQAVIGATNDMAAASAENLDQSAAAAVNAKSTMQAYIDGIYAMLPGVSSTFARLAGAIPTKQNVLLNTALSMAAGQTLPGSITLPESVLRSVAVQNAYAGGTENAARGWALVGEQGPELLFMQGGEKILTNRETEHIFNNQSVVSLASAEAQPVNAMTVQQGQYSAGGGDNVKIELAPVYNINGNAAPEEIREVLQRQNEDLKELVKEAMAELQADQRRKSYN